MLSSTVEVGVSLVVQADAPFSVVLIPIICAPSASRNIVDLSLKPQGYSDPVPTRCHTWMLSELTTQLQSSATEI